jgi:hypothetical protein
LAKKFNIESFPQMKLLPPGAKAGDKPLAFEGDREHDAIVKWITRKLSPPAETIANQEALGKTLAMIRADYTPDGLKNTFLDAISATVGVFRDTSQLVAFEKAASEDVEKHLYYKIVDSKFISDVEKKYNVKAPVVLVFRQWDVTPKVISDKAVLADKAKILSSVETLTDPPSDVVVISTEDEFKAAMKSKVPYVIEFYAPWCSYCTWSSFYYYIYIYI